MLGQLLESKMQKIIESENPLSIDFSLEEINTIGDIDRLRCLKLQNKFPSDFIPSVDIFQCTNSIKEGDSIYRVLEFCVFKNRVLRHSVFTVFKRMGKLDV